MDQDPVSAANPPPNAPDARPEAPSDPLIGQVLAERYRVLSLLGRGGMGAVYRVEHVALKKELALKILPEGLAESDDMVRRFLREAEAAARLDHPNIVRVTDFGRSEEGLFFLAMELLPGRLLADVVQPGGEGTPGVAMAPHRVARVLRQIARALEHAHGVGVIHRDLKPANIILIDREGEQDIVKLLDFGIAKILEPDGRGEALTQAGMVYGTPEYLSPEQAVGDPIDGRADLYSLGVIGWEMLTGELPFRSKSKLEILHKHVHERPPRLGSVLPHDAVSRRLAAVVDQLLEKRRDDRPASAGELAQRLTEIEQRGSDSALGSEPLLGRVGRATRAVGERYLRRSQQLWRSGRTGDRLVVLAPLVALFLVVGLLGWTRRAPLVVAAPPTAEQPIAKLTEPQQIALVEALLGSGQLAAARASLQQIVAAHPQSARAHFLYGHLNYVEGERARALGDYRKALELDPSLAEEPAMRANIRASLDRKGEAPLAIDLLAQTLGPKGVDDLTTCAKSCRSEGTRRRAQEALERRETKETTATPLAGALDSEGKSDADPLTVALDGLRRGKSCALRKSAAQTIIAANDRRYLPALRQARERRGGFLGLEPVNACMHKELDEAIAALGASK